MLLLGLVATAANLGYELFHWIFGGSLTGSPCLSGAFAVCSWGAGSISFILRSCYAHSDDCTWCLCGQSRKHCPPLVCDWLV